LAKSNDNRVYNRIADGLSTRTCNVIYDRRRSAAIPYVNHVDDDADDGDAAEDGGDNNENDDVISQVISL
jgi:hypothetical protein